MEIPLINLTIDEAEETGVEFIALVDTPAIEREWMAFGKTKQRFQIQDKEKRVVSGAAMVSNLPIYRLDEDGNPFYVKFSPDTIEKIVHRFFKSQPSSAVNLMHEELVEGVYIFESFIIDDNKRTPEGFTKLPNGSWFVSMKIENDGVWAKVKDGTFKGFSIEGVFIDQATHNLDKKLIDEVIRVLSEK